MAWQVNIYTFAAFVLIFFEIVASGMRILDALILNSGGFNVIVQQIPHPTHFSCEDGGNVFLGNITISLQDYTVSQPRISQSILFLLIVKILDHLLLLQLFRCACQDCWHRLTIGIYVYDSCSLEFVGPCNMKTDGCRCVAKCHVQCTPGRALQKGILIFCDAVQCSAIITL
jgi:hypothetical protein